MTKEELEYACSLLPEGAYWGDNITAQMALHIAQAACATPADQEPVGYFQFDSTWKTWDEVAEEFKDGEGVVPLFAAPQPPQNAADHIDAQSVRDAWISIDERLPEIIEMYPGSGTGTSEPVLVYLADENDNGEEIAVWRCFRGGQGDTTTIYWDWKSPEVTHWQPLPAPPQKPVSDEVKP